jgi:hypothetical protein
MTPLAISIAVTDRHTRSTRLETDGASPLLAALGTAGVDMVHPRTMIQYSMLDFARPRDSCCDGEGHIQANPRVYRASTAEQKRTGWGSKNLRHQAL